MEIESFDESAYVIDNYEHLDPEVFYSVTRTPGKDIPEESFEYFDSGCDCLDSKCTEHNNCSCLRYGNNYVVTDEVKKLAKEKFGNLPVFECNFRCACYANLKSISKNLKPKVCPNRNVQFGPVKSLEIFNAGPKGLGLKTNEKILAGTFICEYAGEVISLDEAKNRQKNLVKNGEMNYVFILKEYTGGNVCSVTCVDPTHVGNIGRYINHSCEPNSAIVPVRVNDVVPWLCVFALRDVLEGEEICYDYSGNSLKEFAGNGDTDKKPCFCGAASCKKYLPFQPNI